MKLVLFLLPVFLFLSCAEPSKLSLGVQDSSGIQEIANQWIKIEHRFNNAGEIDEALDETLDETLMEFFLLLQKFQESGLYDTYRAIPFSPQIERDLFFAHPYADIPEFAHISDLTLIFKEAIALGDAEKARTVSAEISGILIRLLVVDRDVRQFIGFSYNSLFFALLIFIAVIILILFFMYYSLTRSLKREAEAAAFSHTYMLAQDEERARISRELHDTIIQDMRYLLLETERIGNTDDKNERETLCGKTVPMMSGLIIKARDICNSLIPPDFRFSELPDALRQICLDFCNKTGVDCRAEIDENIKIDFLNMEKRLQVFRIVQEALANIEKHAQAKEVIVTMRDGLNGIVYIGIGDDGRGFNSPLDKNGQIISGIDKSHIGIIIMKERAAILGGNLKIESEIGEGTLVCLEIPAKETINGSIIN